MAVAKVHPADFHDEAKRACQTKLEDAKAIYKHVEPDNLPYLCMDLVYQFTLLVDGFGMWYSLSSLQVIHSIFVEYKLTDDMIEQALILGKRLHW